MAQMNSVVVPNRSQAEQEKDQSYGKQGLNREADTARREPLEHLVPDVDGVFAQPHFTQ
jgi:hypothetical protein